MTLFRLPQLDAGHTEGEQGAREGEPAAAVLGGDADGPAGLWASASTRTNSRLIHYFPQ